MRNEFFLEIDCGGCAAVYMSVPQPLDTTHKAAVAVVPPHDRHNRRTGFLAVATEIRRLGALRRLWRQDPP
jgi:hypothetical protein